MSLYAIGINHHTAPLAVRERLAFSADTLPQALASLTRGRPVPEAAVLSTCNRTELYCAADNAEAAVAWLAEERSVPMCELRPYLYTLSEAEAVRHAFRVASGLDSMVVGEPQILGQMKDAVRAAEQAGTLGTLLSKLFHRAFSVAKEVRTSTAIGANIVSMAAAAVHLAERIFESIGNQKVLFIGAGEMIDLCATHFAARAPKQITVANRTVERGIELAQRFGGNAVRLDALGELLHEYDIVVSCTASPLPIIGLGMVERSIKARRHRPMFMVDLAVPRDIEPEVSELDDVFLYTVDDLAQVVASGVESRQAAVVEAEAIIDSRVQTFLSWVETRESVPLIRALRDSAERARRHEVEHALKLLARGDDPQKVVEALSQRLTNKFLHAPTQALNQGDAAERESLQRTVAHLFRLHGND